MISDKDPRRWQERIDGKIIKEDHTSMANCPRQFINKQVYHNTPVYGPGSRYGGDTDLSRSFYKTLKDM